MRMWRSEGAIAKTETELGFSYVRKNQEKLF